MHITDTQRNGIDTAALEALTQRTGATARRVTDAVIVFNDLVESTPLLVELGDEAYTEVLESLDAARTALLERHDGRLVSLAGDGALMIFTDVNAALAFADEFNQVCDILGVVSRTGIHMGDVMIRSSGDLAGVTVHAAARIESTAPSGGILVSAAAAANATASFVPWGWAELKGIPGATELFEVSDEVVSIAA